MTKMFKILCLSLISLSVSAIEYSKVNQGISNGFLSDCPGSTKPAKIKHKSLEQLKLAVLGPGNVLLAQWSEYNYFQMKKLSKNPELDFTKKTIVYFPGYFETNVLPGPRTIGSLYKELGYNVLILDYFYFTVNHFPLAARMVRPVGKHVGEMLANLTTLGLDPKKLELVTFSLGGHAASFAAKNYRQLTGKNISAITALEPSGPCFRHLGPDQRLDPSDADFVFTVHSNIDAYGIATPLGHVSIFVNGGEYQPNEVWSIPCTIFCSHSKTYFLWMSALINPGIFVAMQCDSVQQARDGNCYERKPTVSNTMDIFVDKSKPGIYYLPTFNRYPYGLGTKGLKREENQYVKHLNWLNAEEVLTM
ncbi:lipase member H-like [Leguminivora glycinivorella]|uniref:lipase member H-like n=1 Tax=Leguminivora glycinivorella TaxID=1035111 RepID=UPI00200D481B|nr:lipase member H-like [Leguminivora glycinivorella]